MKGSKAESKGRDKREPTKEKGSWDMRLRQIKRNKRETKRKHITEEKRTSERKMTERSKGNDREY